MDAWTEAYEEACAVSPKGVAIMIALALYHPDWTTPVRVIFDNQSWWAPLEDGGEPVYWEKCIFGIDWPKQGEEQPEGGFWVDNVSQIIGKLMFDTTGSLHKIRAEFFEFQSDRMHRGPQYRLLGMTVIKFSIEEGRVTCRCGHFDYGGKRVPRGTFDRAIYRGLDR